MKSIVLALATVSTLAGAAYATNTSDIQRYAPNADVSTLTNAEAAQVNNIIHSSDSESEKRADIRAYFD